jgi:hypothetical protein
MIRILIFLFVLIPATAWADFKLSDLVGNWSGSGKYAEPLTTARVRCKLAIMGNDAKVTLRGRCGGSFGAERMVLDFVRQSNGDVIVSSGPGAPYTESPIGALTGTPTRTQLVVRGQSGQESVLMQFAKNADGTMHFATERDGKQGRRISAVTLIRQ